MYCPKCSQLQSSDEMRFCSRCGFPLAGVAMVVVNEGIIPEPAGGPGQTLPSSRKKVMTESALLTGLAWAVALVATFWFDVGGPFENVSKVAALLFFCLGLIGLLRFLYGFLFVKDLMVQPASNTVSYPAAQGGMAGAPRRDALPAQRDWPASDYARRANTKEIAQPRSVTENTTRMLDEQPTDRSE